MHRRLAEYFRTRQSGIRKVEELPWHYAEVGAWKDLESFLTDLDLLSMAWKHDSTQVRRYWSHLSKIAQRLPAEGYQSVVSNPSGSVGHLTVVASLLFKASAFNEAASIWGSLASKFESSDQPEQHAEALGHFAAALTGSGQLHRAMEILFQQECICRARNFKQPLGIILGKRAALLSAMGRPAEAIDLCKEQESISESTNDLWLLQDSLGLQAEITATHRWMIRHPEGGSTVMSAPDFRGAYQLL